MTLQIWIHEDYLENLLKISDEKYQAEDIEQQFHDSVEYTLTMIIDGQMCINIQPDTYIRLTENELLTPLSIQY